VKRALASVPTQEAQQMEVPSRFLDILRDLLAQRFDRRKLDFIAQAIEKKKLNLSLGP
jgi:hypothetical protein